ncbi:MAG: ABC transporter permease [ANME-2 cluster archaeon]|nr:ABC transporter permease [ANME-2 cluster archaeon]MBC2700234.1 ABC transporter permease [ANME-2 cluster archaeon]MBC2707859.1 ABC transporter permease [ANME-2 cluster archaeon]MBC2745965.1 ABC transporter permease [ANME-2 cluster archaeon]MBC2762678.1 ABC transporter permease [ANME-2 cluster archaeon]
MPGDALSYLTDPGADMPVRMTEEKGEILLAYYGLDKPLSEQYINYMVGIIRGDLGLSIYYNDPVLEVILSRLKWTLLLVGTSTAIYITLGILLGATSAWARGRKKDMALLISILSISSFPSFFIGILMVIFFVVKLGIFPLSGAQTAFATYSNPLEEIFDILHHLVLPAATLVISHIGGTYFLMRNSMLGVLGEDYIMTARAKGLSERYILHKHAIKNALLPIVTMTAMTVGFMVTGTIFVEMVFAYPGIGNLLYNAVSYNDYPLLQGIFLFITITIVGANFIADMIYIQLDPRVNHE